MAYLFQRVVPSEFGRIRPSPCRLRDTDSKDIGVYPLDAGRV